MSEVLFRCEGVGRRYGETPVLHDCTFSLSAGSFTVLIGPSGCGKSTFLRCLNRMNDLVDGCKVSGTIELDGNDIHSTQMNVVDLRTKVGMVFQKANPFPMSIYDNIAYGPRCQGIKSKKILDEIVEQSLTKAALWEEVKDRLQESAFGLSGGQQQRLCIARAIAMEPEVILMDEPTSALDEANRDLLLELLREYQETAAILFISHDTEAMKALCPITHVMEHGTIIETQATEQLFIHPQQPWTKRFAEAACHRGEVNWKWTALN